MKNYSTRVLLGLIFILVGLTATAYPFFSSVMEEIDGKREFANYQREIESISADKKTEIKKAESAYEKNLSYKSGAIVDPFEVEGLKLKSPIENLPRGVYGFLAIPKLDVYNNIYLGADEKNLLRGVAQVEGTSLPKGGRATRSVIAGHRGTVKVDMMFRHLDSLKKGDLVYVLNPERTLIYSVEDSEIILPTQNEKLLPKDDSDMLTLLTCNPYLSSRERLLVNCIRREDLEKGELKGKNSLADFKNSQEIEPKVKKVLFKNRIILALILGLWLIFFLIFITELFRLKKSKRYRR